MPFVATNIPRKDYSDYWELGRGDTIGRLVKKWARERPNHPALVFRGRSISWHELDEATDRLATYYLRRGLKKGDRIAILGPNHPEVVYAWIAAAKVGVIPVSLSTRSRKKELEYVLNDAGCRAMVTVASDEGFNFVEAVNEVRPAYLEHTLVYSHGPLEAPGGWVRLYDAIEETEADPALMRQSFPQSFEPLFILYTSGTTGVPKGVVHSHDSFLINGKTFQSESWHLTRDSRSVLAVPFSHMIGHEILFNTGVLLGSTTVLMERYNPVEFIDTIEKERVNFWCGVPTMLLLPLLRVPDLEKRDLRSFTLGVTCGFYMPPDQMQRASDAYGITLLQLVGSTEASGMLMTFPGDPPEVGYHTVGRGLSNEEIKLVDPEGKEVPRGEVGEICYRGPNVCLGYWGKPELTSREIDAEGFWHSGDMGRVVDEQGNIVLVGRKKDIIKRGGFNIYPGEIERFLSDLPQIAESVVFGYPDEVLGEKICAVIVRKPGQEVEVEKIREECRKNMADYKCPDTIKVVDDVPRLPSGKPDKAAIAAQFLQEKGLPQGG